MLRRRLLALPALAALPRAAAAFARRALVFPADGGAHADEARVEWWYVTGALDAGRRGFQITFFRTRTGVAATHPSRFAARQLVFAHAAVTDLDAGRLLHDQRVARAGFGLADAAGGDTAVRLHGWSLARAPGGTYRGTMRGERFAFDLTLAPTQPRLPQGQAGWSRKGPEPQAASLYYSEPQLAVAGRLELAGAPARAVAGRAWLDHEWSDAYLPAGAVGWDWIGMNLDDGGALMAFRMRRADDSALWAGGSWRAAGATAARDFAPHEVRFEPLRRWRSARSGASYPVAWRVLTPAGAFAVQARLDDQELDSRASTGAIYWEGLSELLDATGRRVGSGYLEMTGYAGALKVGAD